MLSVIIPIYNAEKYLKRCINSILRQSFHDLELLLINDGSTDNSLSICIKYTKMDPRIKLIDLKKNLGSEYARLTGINNVKGEWIMFIDADDTLSNRNVISIMMKKAIENDVDLLQFGIQKVSKRGLLKRNHYNLQAEIIEGDKIFNTYYKSFFGKNIFPCCMWSKIIKRTLLEKINIKSLGIFMWEDEAFMLQIFPFLKKIMITPEIGYNYRVGGGSYHYNNVLNDYIKLYEFKERMKLKYKLEDVTSSLNAELKNVFKTDICFKIRAKKDKEEIKRFIEQKINTYPISSLIQFYKSKPDLIGKDPFIQALLNKNSLECYLVCNKIVENKKFINYIKTMIMKYF